jgi:hypothetical protein
MIFSASAAGRKWPYAARRCGKAASLAFGFLLVASLAPAEARPSRSPFAELENALFGKPRAARRARSSAPAVAAIPLPQPRPATAPPRLTEPPLKPAFVETLPKPRPAEAPAASEKPAESPPVAEAPRALSPCRVALTEDIAFAPSVPDIVGPGECGGEDIVRLEAVVLRDRTRVPLKPAATLRCEMATAVAAWLRDDIAPLAFALGSAPAALDNFDSFDCRGRNRVSGAKVSEHGHANALDIRGFTLKSGIAINLTDRAAARDTREKVLQSVCGRFSTVLGPGSDGYHEDHIHLDLAARRSGYRICQWAVYDPMPLVAPLLPAARPDEAPPRPSGEARTEGKGAAPAAVPDANAEDDAEPEPAPPPVKKKRARRI